MKSAVISKLSAGWQRYQKEHHAPNQRAYASLSEKQDPKVLFVTCADSRIEPAVMFQSDPGDLFIARNPGNIVPPMAHCWGEHQPRSSMLSQRFQSPTSSSVAIPTAAP